MHSAGSQICHASDYSVFLWVFMDPGLRRDDVTDCNRAVFIWSAEGKTLRMAEAG
jgi:hypothetical protein